jgi:MFS family permease
MSFPALASVLPRLVPRELLQQANGLQSVVRGTFRILGPTISALLVVGVGPGWALAVDGATWLVAAAMLLLVRIPPPPPVEERPSTFTQLHEGWQYVRSTPWLWSVSLAFCFLHAIQSGAWNTLGPAEAKLTIGAKGWGYVLSAQSVGLLLMTFVLLRRRIDRPLRSGMVGIAMLGLPMLGLGLSPHLPVLIVIGFLAGLGNEVFTIGWALAMQEHVPEDMLSRAYSYDALGSFAAMPVGQLAFGPLGVALGLRPVIAVAGAAYVVIALLPLASRSVRGLRRVPVEETVAAAG